MHPYLPSICHACEHPPNINSRPLRPEACPGEQRRLEANECAGHVHAADGDDRRRLERSAGWTRDATLRVRPRRPSADRVQARHTSPETLRAHPLRTSGHHRDTSRTRDVIPMGCLLAIFAAADPVTALSRAAATRSSRAIGGRPPEPLHARRRAAAWTTLVRSCMNSSGSVVSDSQSMMRLNHGWSPVLNVRLARS
jgi:hypothetical protein